MIQRSKRWAVAFGRRIPPGLRALLGVLLIIGGILGFLPILGFWMLPLGVILIVLDLRSLRRLWKHKIGLRSSRSGQAETGKTQPSGSTSDIKGRTDDQPLQP